MKETLALVLGALLLAASGSGAEDDLKAFPPPRPGMVRYVLRLPRKADESLFRVQLIAGRTVRVDERNRYFFPGRIERETVPGWGFDRYVVSPLGPMAGTLVAVDPGAPDVERFVALGGEPYLVGYNSRLPVVVYAPDGVEVRYRIWSAGADANALDRG